jgi:hypothetical protein
VQAYYDEGHGFVECTRRFGFTRSAWNKALARGALDVPRSVLDDRRRRHNWAEVLAYYDAGASMRDCRVRFGFCALSWTKAVRRGEIKPRLTVRSIVDVLKSGSSRWCKKAKLLREGYLADRCSRCGISQWRGEHFGNSDRPHKRSEKRLAHRKPSNALPELPQANRDLWRSQRGPRAAVARSERAM